MWVLEIYQSKQGEGRWTGKYSIFIRTLGCPLRCRFCDTAYAQLPGSDDEQGAGADLSPEEIAGRIVLLDLPHVVLTGGEPMASPEIVELTHLLKDLDYLVTIETAGIIDLPVHCDLMSISPKLSNSTPRGAGEDSIAEHERLRQQPEVVQRLIERYEYQLKFVVDAPDDFSEIEHYLAGLRGVLPDRVCLMPQTVDVARMKEMESWILPYCVEKGYRYCPRMQIVWYGNTRRT